MSAESRTDVRIEGLLEAPGRAERGAEGAGRVGQPENGAGALLGAQEGGGQPGGAFQMRCPHCHALQFLARVPWESVAIDEATVAIKCWRRTCKKVLGLRPTEGQPRGAARTGEVRGV